jgi:hypothetical protein
LGGTHHLLRRAAVTQDGSRVIRRHLGDIRILAKPAAKITPHRGNGVGKAARQKMKERFFFDGINVPGDDLAVHQGFQHSGLIFPDTANTASTFFYHTAVTAQIAFNFMIL